MLAINVSILNLTVAQHGATIGDILVFCRSFILTTL